MIISKNFHAPARATAVLSAATVLALSGTAPASAGTGDLDPSWSGDGLQSQTAGSQTALASAVQSDGRLLVAGTGSVDDGTPAFGGTYVARYTAAGALDPSYGVNGRREVSIAPGAEYVRDVVVDSAGRALVGGYVTAPDYPDETDVFVLRLTATGAVDTSFGGGDGIVMIDRTNHDRGGALAVTNKRILVGTGLDAGGNWALEWNVFALTQTGATDTSFSGDGVAPVPVAKVGSFDSLRDLALQADGKIVLGGSSGAEFATARMTAGGAMDTTYSGDGVARTPVEGGGAGYRLLVQPDGKIVVAGYATATGRADTDFAAVRWTKTGTLDRQFGGDGIVLVDVAGQRNNRAQSAALGADDKIVLVGSADTATGLDSAVARLDWDGSLDTSFSGDGLVVTNTHPTSNEQLESVTIAPGDAIRAFGSNLDGWTLLGYTGSANYTLTVSDAVVTEPDTGTATASFQVKLNPASPQAVTVRYATAKGTAIAPEDFTARSGVLTIPAGATTATITVPVVGDIVPELDETFRVSLSQPTNAGIGDGSGTGTITNDD